MDKRPIVCLLCQQLELVQLQAPQASECHQYLLARQLVSGKEWYRRDSILTFRAKAHQSLSCMSADFHRSLQRISFEFRQKAIW